ncbi:hypothetical protein ACP4OV_007285 [Aristida adscensionis]
MLIMHMAPKPWKQTVRAGLVILLVLLLGVALQLPGSIAQQDKQANINSALHGLDDSCGETYDERDLFMGRCAQLLGVAASGGNITDQFGDRKAVLQRCCKDMNELSELGFTESCGCSFVKSFQGHNLPIDSGDCSLARLKERCSAATGEAPAPAKAKAEEEQLSKLGPELLCAVALTEAVSSSSGVDNQSCCQDFTDLSTSEFSEDCACAFVKATEENKGCV